MKRSCRAMLCLGLLIVPAHDARAAGSTMLGGFQPVAVETGARAAWVCPAAIGFYGNSQLIADGVFHEQADGKFSELSMFTLAAGSEGRAYGWQMELDDVPGVPDWTLALGQSVGRGRVRFGTFVEWRGGDGNHFDAGLSAFAPLGESLRAAVAIEDLFASDVDGADGVRRARAGLSARMRTLWASWDWRGDEHETARHFFGLGIDATYVRLAGIMDDEEGWTVEARLTMRERTVGGGITRPETGPETRFATIEAGSPARRLR